MPMPETTSTKMAIDQKLGLKSGGLGADAEGAEFGSRGGATAGPVGDLWKRSAPS